MTVSWQGTSAPSASRSGSCTAQHLPPVGESGGNCFLWGLCQLHLEILVRLHRGPLWGPMFSIFNIDSLVWFVDVRGTVGNHLSKMATVLISIGLLLVHQCGNCNSSLVGSPPLEHFALVKIGIFRQLINSNFSDFTVCDSYLALTWFIIQMNQENSSEPP